MTITRTQAVAAVALVILAFVASRLIFGPIWDIAVAVVFWAITGALAGRIIRGAGYGLAANVLIGFIGGFVGNLLLVWLMGWTIGSVPLIGPIIIGCIGAIIFVLAVRVVHNADFGK